ncbi:hypothetical protein BU24DRAFT_467670 [Aaosphaeria arxii CBS 175.79]|uniref:Uncharacterized protein n=1 Tax=Aaosphaeria arxii CBS 175.79 TaxID=1450172 RepID=A0A6A5XBG7_9PLEO|nr:uncharacterized protein BU24DRAFT_467670 [Aaosphaeria arxii CBS 175.79]KAF2010196.1 hypothetical protein BU24DRAFT_467670 [Aaosphaeria arxii CBS 175.79]
MTPITIPHGRDIKDILQTDFGLETLPHFDKIQFCPLEGSHKDKLHLGCDYQRDYYCYGHRHPRTLVTSVTINPPLAYFLKPPIAFGLIHLSSPFDIIWKRTRSAEAMFAFLEACVALRNSKGFPGNFMSDVSAAALAQAVKAILEEDHDTGPNSQEDMPKIEVRGEPTRGEGKRGSPPEQTNTQAFEGSSTKQVDMLESDMVVESSPLEIANDNNNQSSSPAAQGDRVSAWLKLHAQDLNQSARVREATAAVLSSNRNLQDLEKSLQALKIRIDDERKWITKYEANVKKAEDANVDTLSRLTMLMEEMTMKEFIEIGKYLP